MHPFTYSRALDQEAALGEVAAHERAKFLGGGTNLIDLMKMGVERPDKLIDINRLPLAGIEELPGGGVRVGALARNSDLAERVLLGMKPDKTAFETAARVELEPARGYQHNGFKIELARRALVRALSETAALA